MNDKKRKPESRIVVCSCGAVWPWDRFKRLIEDCPHCNPKDWGLAISLCSNVKPIGFVNLEALKEEKK